MKETAVENAANILTVNRLLGEKKDIFYASMNTRDCIGGFVYRVVIMLDNTRSTFFEFYYEYYCIPRNTPSSA